MSTKRDLLRPYSPQRMAERIAALVSASPVTAHHTARILRTATDAEGKRLDLWPQPGSGARITSFTPTQMANLLLALAGRRADPGTRDRCRLPQPASGTGVLDALQVRGAAIPTRCCGIPDRPSPSSAQRARAVSVRPHPRR